MKEKSAYHWLVVACCCGLMAAAYGISINCAGVFIAPVAETLGVGRGDVSLYMTMMSMVTGLANLFVVRALGKVRLPVWLAIGGLLDALSMAAWSVVTHVWQLYALAVVHGIGNGMIGSVVINMMISCWFNRSIGLATGITFSTAGIVGAVLSPILQGIIDSSGWQTAHLIASLLIVLTVLPSIFVITLDPRRKKCLPYGGESTISTTASAHEEGIKEAANEGHQHTLAVVAVLVAGFSASFIVGLGSHVSGYATSSGWTAAEGALLVTGVMVGNTLSKLIFGVVSDKAGAKPAYLGFTLIGLFGLAGMLLFGTSSFILVMIASALFGFMYALTGVGNSQLTRSQFGREQGSHYYALTQTIGSVGHSIATAAIGYIYDFTGSYSLALMLLSALAVLIFIMILLFTRKS